MSDPAADLTFDASTGVRDASVILARAFRARGLPTPDVDARFLIQGLLGIDGARVIAEPHAPLAAAADALRVAALRRLQREPVARILGWREFYGRRFAITPDVLDPRPDTEALIALALEIGREKGWYRRAIRFADIGVGSGAIALTLLAEWPLASAVATDISPAALAVAGRNAEALGVAGRLTLQENRGIDGCESPFDLVLSNPPYIPTSEIAALDDDVRRFDPALALDGGPDGLAAYREIAAQISGLKHGVQVVLEVGADQTQKVLEIFERIGAVRSRTALDLGGHVRAVALEIHS
ncbi:MAG: peptide chain release factor N(5)-glutamine methyltransferase [Hyphomicrobium sp.]